MKLKVNKAIFNDVYYPFLKDYSKRYEVYYGGAGSGKSHFVFQKILIKALKSKRKVLICRKTAKSNKNSTFQMATETLRRFKIYEFCKVNMSDLTIVLPNGSTFLFAGLDDVEKLKSIVGITDIVCEECSELSLDDVDQLDLRLRANEDCLQMFFMFNPISKVNWTYKRWFSEDTSVNDDTFILKTTYKDNRFLPDSYIKTLENMKKTNYTYYVVYALGQFASLDKLVFSNWCIEDFDYTTCSGDLLCGLDFGFVADPTAFVCSMLDGDNLYIFKEHYQKGMLNNQIAEMIKYNGFTKSTIIADCAEQKSIAEIKGLGVSRIRPATKGQGSVLQGIQKLQQLNIIVHPSCENTIVELQNYSWKKDKQTSEYTNEPKDEYNHIIDALRYSLQVVEKNTKLKTLPKFSL